ncbi:hypothetical protein H4R35_004363 [Dimargaris xerosporica]|nr:hypothetical protein H4R35_004363 [Dimargaris xerosporica]
MRTPSQPRAAVCWQPYTTTGMPRIRPSPLRVYGLPVIKVVYYASVIFYGYHVVFQFLLHRELKDERAAEIQDLEAAVAELERKALNNAMDTYPPSTMSSSST